MRFLEPLGISVHMYGLGTLGEIFEGDSPFTPHGAIAQAWTVGEVLRGSREIQNYQEYVEPAGAIAVTSRRVRSRLFRRLAVRARKKLIRVPSAPGRVCG